MSELDPCENCGHIIGKLEKSFVWKESVVCAECFQRLKQIDEIDPSEPEEMSIPASEFEKPLPPAVEVSTWSPKEAALLERAERDRRKRLKRRGLGTVFVLGSVLTAAALIGCIFIPNVFFQFYMMILLYIGIALLWIVIACFPIIVAQERRHSNLSGVKAITVLGFFIPLLWLVAIVWAYSAPDPDG
jgi:hypothetical protein